MQNKFNLKAGVIIIGSLFWQDDLDIKKKDNIRNQWRQNNLTEDRIIVKLPTRYGRYSNGGIYTMVFSTYCERYKKLGTGFIAPFKSPVITGCNALLDEAKALSEAEGMGKELESRLGRVVILFNPDRIKQKVKDKIINAWRNSMPNTLSNNSWEDFKMGREKPCVTPDFQLNIRWPSPLNNKDNVILSKFDLLLATATKPKHKDNSNYPSISEIAQSIRSDLTRFYFINNIKHGICTFQDNLILNII